ncbi:hypothetical protein NDU88_000485 [Pleurodeles waltl]|uniref:Uncharacterized protein n=1 Tax=Pleurodeles waltl TaxID=8319 RepID=A0AAV7LXJ7_PLEWA|nr:hypothetical protein NDU88_000485 [Pleurodeles waltl]
MEDARRVVLAVALCRHSHAVEEWRPESGARLLNYIDRDAILEYAGTQSKLTYQNSAIMILPDYTKMVQQQRETFTKAKKRLQELNLLYMLLYPARMRVVYESQTHFFDTPEEVLHWTDEQVGLRPHTPLHVDSDSSQGPDGSCQDTAFKKKRKRSCSTWRSRGLEAKT